MQLLVFYVDFTLEFLRTQLIILKSELAIADMESASDEQFL